MTGESLRSTSQLTVTLIMPRYNETIIPKPPQIPDPEPVADSNYDPPQCEPVPVDWKTGGFEAIEAFVASTSSTHVSIDFVPIQLFQILFFIHMSSYLARDGEDEEHSSDIYRNNFDHMSKIRRVHSKFEWTARIRNFYAQLMTEVIFDLVHLCTTYPALANSFSGDLH